MIKTSSKIPESFRKLKADTDFKITPRLILSVEAQEKRGKTHFALQAPGPIGAINYDIGFEGVADKFRREGKMIGSIPIDMPAIGLNVNNMQKMHVEAYKKARGAYWELMQDPSVRTVVVDTMSDMWDSYRLAEFGKLTKVLPIKYTNVNAGFMSLVRKSYSYKKNVIYIHKLKESYTNTDGDAVGEWDGTYKRAGFKGIGGLVQVVIRMDKRRVVSKKTGQKRTQFGFEIIDCRLDPHVEGNTYWGAEATFKNLAQTLIPDSDEGDWE